MQTAFNGSQVCEGDPMSNSGHPKADNDEYLRSKRK